MCPSHWTIERDTSGKKLRENKDGVSRPDKKIRVGEPEGSSERSSKREDPDGDDDETHSKRVRIRVKTSFPEALPEDTESSLPDNLVGTSDDAMTNRLEVAHLAETSIEQYLQAAHDILRA